MRYTIGYRARLSFIDLSVPTLVSMCVNKANIMGIAVRPDQPTNAPISFGSIWRPPVKENGRCGDLFIARVARNTGSS